MADKCFYCDDFITENTFHHINFFHNYAEREETLCPACYKEWLEGIKE